MTGAFPVKICELTAADVIWPFERPPYVLCGGGKWPRQTIIDPFPCYSFSSGIVSEETTKLQTIWPLPFELLIYLMHFETASHTNGWYQMDQADDVRIGSIALLGKRVPIHPAAQRYAIAHEYGHAVEDALKLRRGLVVESSEILADYRKLRGLPADPPYGGRTWHCQSGEIFADDFRILVARAEIDFWPHPEISRPENVSEVREWWGQQLAAA